MRGVSFIIALQDEQFSVSEFFSWFQQALVETNFLRRSQQINLPYEIIIVTNNPHQTLVQELQKNEHAFPLTYYIDKSVSLKATLLAKGFSLARYETLATGNIHTLSAKDVFLKTLKKLQNNTDLIVLTTKITEETTQEELQTITSSSLFALQKNESPSIIVMKNYVWKTIQFQPLRDSTFFIAILHRAQEAGFGVKAYEILSLDTMEDDTFFTRVKNSLTAFTQVFLVKHKKIHPQYIAPNGENTMMNAGFGYKRKQYVTHTVLQYTDSAIESFIFKQIFFFFYCLLMITFLFLLFPVTMLQIVIAIISAVYLIDVSFNVYLVIKTFKKTYEITYTEQEIQSLNEQSLPTYSILCPLYKEAHVLGQFLDAIAKLDYPKNKLDVLLLLEEDDRISINTIQSMKLPSYVQTVIVPHSLPKTKPKACNYGLSYVKGDYVVIYDAEDMPDPLQLKKAFIGFQKAPKNTVCLQAKLNYYNIYQNVLTRFFAAEYSLWFDVTLTGLQALNTTIPLGGTSNHFRTADIKKLKAWDPFNVTEDADLGVRLFKEGYQTAVIDSVTLEEANSKVGNWLRQRSRWIKGYMQTYLVHTREIIPFIQKRGRHAFIFHLVIGGKLAFIFINPFLWIITLVYFIFHAQFGAVIDTFYPPVVLYMAIITLIFGNYFYFFCYVLGCVKKEQWGLIKYVYFIPLYWLLISIAGFMGFYQLLFKPHYWEKTVHGLHLKKKISATDTNPSWMNGLGQKQLTLVTPSL